MQTPTTPLPINVRPSLASVAALVALSVSASLFLAWLVYVHQPIDAAGNHLPFLPGLNAILNGCCAVALFFGIRYIMNGEILRHRNSMLTAFLFSALFLVSYITNHALHGDAIFPRAHPFARFIYLWILLVPHILASVVALPMILITFFFSLTSRFHLHRKIARYTYPVWLYVSISGVIVYGMLAAFR